MENYKPPQQPPVESGDQGNQGNEVTLEQMTKECMDSQGYVIFIGVLSPQRDDKGFNLINFRYRRYHYSFEDTKRAVEEFNKAYRRDLEAI